MLSKIAAVSALAASVLGQYAPPPPPPPAKGGYDTGVAATKPGWQATTTTLEVTKAVEWPYYYEDYDQLVAAGGKNLYYSHALTKEAADARKLGAAATGWSEWKPIEQQKLKNAKGVTFCGKKDDKYNHYGQVFVADEEAQKVYAWDWAPKEGGQPWEAELKGDAWVAYDGNAQAAAYAEATKTDVSAYKSAPTDVQCGPDGGIFIADKGNNAIYWANGEALAAKDSLKAVKAVVPPECGVAVKDVRSLAWNADTNQLTWSNDAAVAEEKGVFSANFRGGVVRALDCSANVDACNSANWNPACNADLKKADIKFDAKDKVWGVENKAYGENQVYVSKGDEKLYQAKGAAVQEYAATAVEVTTVQYSDDKNRQVLFAVDQQAGQVYAVTPDAKANKVQGKTGNAYAVAYNDAYGWQGELKPLVDEASASTVSVAVGAVLAVVAALL